MQPKIRLFIDFDRVLFDTDHLRQDIVQVFLQAGFSSENQVLQDYKNGVRKGMLYRPEEHFASVQAAEPEVKANSQAVVEGIYTALSNLLYDNAEDFLQNLNRGAYQVELLTLGDPAFQQKKIDLTGIAHYFDKVLLCTVEKWEFLRELTSDTEPFIIIDDRLDTIQTIEKGYPASFGFFKDYKNQYPEYAGEHSVRVTTLEEIFTVPLPEPFPSLKARQP